MKIENKVIMLDIDGTICDDIKNENNHLYATAEVFPDSLKIVNKWYNDGNIITFFTAREEKDREVTEKWLKETGFKYHGLMMDKPRCGDHQEYMWIDNRKVRGVTYTDKWDDLKVTNKDILTFD